MILFNRLPPNACAAYRNLYRGSSPRAIEAREHCEDLWRDFQDLADPNFRTSFPIALHQRWFEMYLAVTLRRAEVKVSAPGKGRGPDLLVEHNGKRVWIEATCPGPGDPGNPDSVPEPEYVDANGEPIVSTVPVREHVLRITGALHAKAKSFEAHTQKGLIRENDSCVVAINLRGVPWMWVDHRDRVQRAVYGLGDQYMTFRGDSKEVETGRLQVSELPKAGTTIGVESFLRPTMPHVSALLTATADCANLPEVHGSDLEWWPNLTAQCPVDFRDIPVGSYWQAIEEANGNLLLSRNDK